jgi:opacity protein-like surface antigen
MKKTLFTTIGILIYSITFGQTDNGASQSVLINNIKYKQSAGDKSLELAFDPFNASDVFSVPTGFGIRFRKFNSESLAFRVGVDLSFSNYIAITQQKDEAANRLELKDKFSSFGLTLRPGFEKHLLSSERLSPYFGGEVILGWNTSTDKEERQAGAAIEDRVTKNGSAVDGFRFGFGAIAGVDFYIAQRLYLGFELNYTVTYYTRATEKTTDFDGTETLIKNGSAFILAPQAFGSFRIGYLF